MDGSKLLVAAIAVLAVLTAVLTVLVISLIKKVSELKSENGKQLALLPLLYSKIDSESAERSRDSAYQSDRISEFMNSSLKNQLEQTKQLTETLDNLSRRAGEEYTSMRETLQANLDKIQGTVDKNLSETLSTRLDSSFKAVSDQLENVYTSLGEMKELSGSVTKGVTGLTRVLSNVKSRGTWAETQLKGILDDIVPTLYETNVATDPSSQKRVEFAVKVVGDDGSTVLMPLDSKFPTEDYARLCDAAENGDAQGLQEARKALLARVQSEAKSVSEYIHEPVTTPFAVMYLATEGLYAEVAANGELLSRLRTEQKVMVCGPTTVAALLNSLALGMRTVTINRKAEEIQGLLVNIRSQYTKFAAQLEKTRHKLEEAGQALGEAEKRNGLIYKKLSSLEAPDTGEGGASGDADTFAEIISD